MGVSPASREDLPALVDALHAGFAGDPVFRWMFEGDRFDELLRGWLEMVVGVAVERGPALLADDDAGAAVWTDLGVELAGEAELATVAAYLDAAVGPRGAEVLGALGAVGAHKPAEPAPRTLVYVAVRPEARGRGLGAELIAPLLDASDADGAHAYLHSTNPETQPFYEARGFAPLASVPTADAGPAITPMWREPR
jgi:GNAT superfamily N-acetyltransferase